MPHRSTLSKTSALLLAVSLQVATMAHADEGAKPEPSCTVVTEEAPRGGQLELTGHHLGRTPLVRIGDAVTRILRRGKELIAVQIPRDSDGGPVTVQVDGKRIECGTLKIIGKNR